MVEDVKELKNTYDDIRDEIVSRISEFEEIWDEGDEERLFDELTFCLFTPQSKAKVCWETVRELREEEMIEEGEKDEISEAIKRVRFRSNKAGYLVEAREKFGEDFSIKDKISSFDDPMGAREWIVDNVKGLGYKEASHFLRNIGKGKNIAILDRHILKNLDEMGVIDEVPKTLTKKRYLEIEKKMKEFSDEVGIPVDHLDLVLWYNETGEVFK